jgi:hypothetical protein
MPSLTYVWAIVVLYGIYVMPSLTYVWAIVVLYGIYVRRQSSGEHQLAE